VALLDQLLAVASREAAEGDHAVGPVDVHDLGRRHAALCPPDRVHFGMHALGRIHPEIALDDTLAVDPDRVGVAVPDAPTPIRVRCRW
jgi:hypothetical protein